jgi:hypothetical protein
VQGRAFQKQYHEFCIFFNIAVKKTCVLYVNLRRICTILTEKRNKCIEAKKTDLIQIKYKANFGVFLHRKYFPEYVGEEVVERAERR